MSYLYQSTSLKKGSDTYNEVQAKMEEQEREEESVLAKKINDDWRTKKTQQKIKREQQEQQEKELRERRVIEQQEQELEEFGIEQQQVPPQEPTFLDKLKSSVSTCIGKTEDCLNPYAANERDRRFNNKLSDQYVQAVNDSYKKWLHTYTRKFQIKYENAQEELRKAQAAAETAKTNLAIATTRRDLALQNVKKNGYAALVRETENFDVAVKNMTAANKAVAAKQKEVAEANEAAMNKDRIDVLAQRAAEDSVTNPYYNYKDIKPLPYWPNKKGGSKTKKIKHRHHKKSLRHHKKSLRHRNKSLRHRNKSMKHHNKY